jgi:hypothetical protein
VNVKEREEGDLKGMTIWRRNSWYCKDYGRKERSRQRKGQKAVEEYERNCFLRETKAEFLLKSQADEGYSSVFYVGDRSIIWECDRISSTYNKLLCNV